MSCHVSNNYMIQDLVQTAPNGPETRLKNIKFHSSIYYV